MKIVQCDAFDRKVLSTFRLLKLIIFSSLSDFVHEECPRGEASRQETGKDPASDQSNEPTKADNFAFLAHQIAIANRELSFEGETSVSVAREFKLSALIALQNMIIKPVPGWKPN